jgi:DedD protein
MALFKFRKADDDRPQSSQATQSIEVLRKRALHRLIGSAVLVLLGVVGLPLLFDHQPRPITVDIPIEIPDAAKVPPLGGASAPAILPNSSPSKPESSAPVKVPTASNPAPAAGRAPVVAPPVVVPPASAPQPVAPKPTPAPQPAQVSKSVPAASEKPAAAANKPTDKPTDKPSEKPTEKPVAAPEKNKTPDDGAKARALLEGRTPPKEPAHSKPTNDAEVGRFVVQFGAFTDVQKAHEARLKVEKAGFKTYAQVVESAQGKKYRVRVGPYTQKNEADKAAQKIKALDLPAAVLKL